MAEIGDLQDVAEALARRALAALAAFNVGGERVDSRGGAGVLSDDIRSPGAGNVVL